MTEEEQDDVEEEQEVKMTEEEPDFGEILDETAAQVDALHDQLDAIKDAGQQIPEQLQEAVPEEAEQGEVMDAQQVITKANLLYRRVENGDSNVVRGE